MTQAKPDMKTTAGKLADLRNRLAATVHPAGVEATEATHAAGGFTARERLTQLCDEDSFVETDALARHRASDFGFEKKRPLTDGVITGYGTVAGRRVCVFAQDESVFDAALGEVYADKLLKIYNLATKTGVPIVGFYTGMGPRPQEGVAALHAYAKVLAAATEASGLVPQIAVVTGPVASLQAVYTWMADVVVADHPSAHLPADSPQHAITQVRALLSLLPANNRAEAPRVSEEAVTGVTNLDELIPDDEGATYDVRSLISEIVDVHLTELQAHIGPAIITGLGHVEGRAVGVLATDPEAKIDAPAATKAARFLRMCDVFNLPVIQIIDTPGIALEDTSDYQASAQLAYANAELTVGTLTLITRNALGASYVLLGAKGTGADLVYAWPTARIATLDAAEAASTLGVKEEDYTEEYLTPYRAAESGLVDAVIEPAASRTRIAEGLALLERKVVDTRPKKHGNIVL